MRRRLGAPLAPLAIAGAAGIAWAARAELSRPDNAAESSLSENPRRAKENHRRALRRRRSKH